jgi:hypothetical protein
LPFHFSRLSVGTRHCCKRGMLCHSWPP